MAEILKDQYRAQLDTIPIELTYEKQSTTHTDLIEFCIFFTYYGHTGIMLIFLSKSLADDPHINLEELFKDEVNLFALQNPPTNFRTRNEIHNNIKRSKNR